MERCLALVLRSFSEGGCEADSGRHRRKGPAAIEQGSGKKTCRDDATISVRVRCREIHQNAGWRPLSASHPPSLKLRRTRARQRSTGGDPYSRRFVVLIVLSHQRRPTNRKRQSLRNSGGLPSAAWPRNWQIQPRVNSDNGIFQNPRISGASRNNGIETAIMGIPNVWKTRLTGF
jgi:hypothetical protein